MPKPTGEQLEILSKITDFLYTYYDGDFRGPEYFATLSKSDLQYKYSWDEIGISYAYRIYLTQRIVSLRDERSNRAVPLSKKELKFFDQLGFDLAPQYKIETKQEIEDWFTGGK